MKRGRGSAAPRILHCDNHLLVVVKAAGIPTVPDASGDESLLDLAKRWVRVQFKKPGRAFLGVVHRLDRPVSGIVVFARTSKAAARLSRSLRERSARKAYRGVGEGRPCEPEGVLEQWLEKDAATNRVRALRARTAAAKHAVTRWRVLAQAGDRTLYEFLPETGRPHQLRACAASLGTPLVGDVKYGAREPLPDASIALHATELEIEHPTRKERLCFVDLPPRRSPWDLFRPGTHGRSL